MADILKQFGNAARAQAAIRQADAVAKDMAEHCDQRIEKMKTTLRSAKEKLELYRAEHSGGYVGGVEFTQLMKMIDQSLDS